MAAFKAAWSTNSPRAKLMMLQLAKNQRTKEPKNQKTKKKEGVLVGDTAQVHDDGLTMAIIRCSEDQIGAKDKFLICIVQMVSEL